MTNPINRQVLLASRPIGLVTPSNFRLTESPAPQPGEGEALVKNLYLSLDPAMRGWMTDRDSYVPPVPIDGVMRGGTLAEVVASNRPDLAVGDKVSAFGGWQDYVIVGPKDMVYKVPEGLPVPLTAHLSLLGITGLTAYFGMLEIGEPRRGETVVVSTAAGAVGSVAGQIAKIMGCRVVGLTGSDDKCTWIRDELGYDVAINYKTEDVGRGLSEACPTGIDVYFDNVGGPILDAVLARIRPGARIVLCGAISAYNATEVPPGPSNYTNLIVRSARMQGFIVLDYLSRAMEAGTKLAQWSLEGKLKYREEVVEGLENAPDTIGRLFDGSNKGKLIIKI